MRPLEIFFSVTLIFRLSSHFLFVSFLFVTFSLSLCRSFSSFRVEDADPDRPDCVPTSGLGGADVEERNQGLPRPTHHQRHVLRTGSRRQLRLPGESRKMLVVMFLLGGTKSLNNSKLTPPLTQEKCVIDPLKRWISFELDGQLWAGLICEVDMNRD